MNPIFIPKSYEETNNGRMTFYGHQLIQEKDIRLIEHFDEEGFMRAVNVWGICRPLKKSNGGFVAQDNGIDMETMRELRDDIKKLYPKQTKITFY